MLGQFLKYRDRFAATADTADGLCAYVRVRESADSSPCVRTYVWTHSTYRCDRFSTRCFPPKKGYYFPSNLCGCALEHLNMGSENTHKKRQITFSKMAFSSPRAKTKGSRERT